MKNKPPRHIYLMVLILIPLLIGLLTFKSYGKSSDEQALYTYSNKSLQAYTDLIHGNLNPDLGKGNYRYYGPAFLMLANLIVRLSTNAARQLNPVDVWHLIYFLSFLTGVIGLYFLAKRWLSDLAAFTTTALFASQPLLWGHAFINPKDVPFMSFCILSMYTGVVMVHKVFPNQASWDISNFKNLIHLWQNAKQDQRLKLIINMAIFVFLIGMYILGQHWLQHIFAAILQAVFSARPGSTTAVLLSMLANKYQSTSPENYVPKIMKLFNSILWLMAAVSAVNIFQHAWKVFSEPNIKISSVILEYLCDTLQKLKTPSIVVAGVFLGLTTSIRILGPALGLIILILAIYQAKIKAWALISAYLLIAAITSYLTWPFLWAHPFSRAFTIVNYMSDFPWLGKVLFGGVYYPVDQLPKNYVPFLFEIQFTEPALLLFISGAFFLIYKTWQRTISFEIVLIVLSWGILPFLAFTVFHPNLYDNTRQLLFIVPPLFIIAGLSVDWIIQRLRQPLSQHIIVILLLLPGIYGIWNLHPYEYTYYNSFAKVTQNNQRQFETDYWMTSFREATEYLNKTAPKNSKILVYGSNISSVSDFARKDLVIDDGTKKTSAATTGYNYAIITSRYDWDRYTLQNWQILHTIQRNGNTLAVVKQKP